MLFNQAVLASLLFFSCRLAQAEIFTAVSIASGAQIASAATSLITSGTSLYQSFNDDQYRVRVAFEIENWTKWILDAPKTHCVAGKITSPPSIVFPLKREGMNARKRSIIVEGSYGTVSWLIKPMKRRVVIMWDAPFNFDFHHNTLAIAITNEGVTHHMRDWYNRMYKGYDVMRDFQSFKKQEYFETSDQISINDGIIEVTAIMSTSHKAKVKIVVRPMKKEGLPLQLAKLIESYDY